MKIENFKSFICFVKGTSYVKKKNKYVIYTNELGTESDMHAYVYTILL